MDQQRIEQANRNADDQQEGYENVGDIESKDVFSTYKCTTILGAKIHPGQIAEASSLSAISLPESQYPLRDSVPAAIWEHGKLSGLQLEGVKYACQKHCEWLVSGERAGFFIGDGAGVGKGRQIAGIIIDNFVRGRRRHVWVSTSSDLHVDALRDLRDLGCYMTVINNCQQLDKERKATGLSKDMKEGVLFITYSTLIRGSKGQGSRVQQIIDWVGGSSFSGCLVFDECHKAKNFAVGGSKAGGTQVAKCVLELQERLPSARVVYCSATGVSEVQHMAYLTRLGLWGAGTAFNNFEAFCSTMKNRGVSFMEMLAIEMKESGKYVARALAFKDAEFVEVECKLSAQQRLQYDQSVVLWQHIRRVLSVCIDLTQSSQDVWRVYWGTLQRYFKLLCCAFKVPTIVQRAKQCIQQGQCVVVGLQTTGEAVGELLNYSPGQQCSMQSTCKLTLQRFVEKHLPVHIMHHKAENDPQRGRAVESCQFAAQSLLAAIDELVLPNNFLDQLIDELGGPDMVAEMTGRRYRIVRQNNGHCVYSSRAATESGAEHGQGARGYPTGGLDQQQVDSVNVKEQQAFMKGQKLVAIISDAASTGISLHSSLKVPNQRRRVHMTMELPWSADKAIQQLGRSHRSSQASAPIYMLLTTDVGGEKRFASAVATRLLSLGALTRGDRRAASGIELTEAKYDTTYGRNALKHMYGRIVQGEASLPPGLTLNQLLQGVINESPGAQPLGVGFETQTHDTDPQLKRVLGSVSQHLGKRVDLIKRGSQLQCEVELDRRVQVVQECGRVLEALQSDDGLVQWFYSPGIALAKQLLQRGGQAAVEQLVVMQLHKELRSCVGCMGVLGDGVDGNREAKVKATKEAGGVKRFLNRLLSVPINRQTMLLNYFIHTLEVEISNAKEEGRYSEGVGQIVGAGVKPAMEPVAVWSDPVTGRKTYQHAVLIDRGMALSTAKRRLQNEVDTTDTNISDLKDTNLVESGFYISRDKMFGKQMALLAIQQRDNKQLFTITRPNTGELHVGMHADQLKRRYIRVDSEDPQLNQVWEYLYDYYLENCIHGANCKAQFCQAGKRQVTINVLSGSIVRLWGYLQTVLDRHEVLVSKYERGVRFPIMLLDAVVKVLADATEQLSTGGTGQVLQPDQVTPIDTKSLSKAFNPPKTVLDFFKQPTKTAKYEDKTVNGSVEHPIDILSQECKENLSQSSKVKLKEDDKETNLRVKILKEGLEKESASKDQDNRKRLRELQIEESINKSLQSFKQRKGNNFKQKPLFFNQISKYRKRQDTKGERQCIEQKSDVDVIELSP